MKKIAPIGCIVAALVLMATPYGVERYYADTVQSTIAKEYYSFFSGKVLAYGNWLPFISALMAIAALILLLIGLKRNTKKAANICIVAASLTSLSVVQGQGWRTTMVAFGMQILFFLALVILDWEALFGGNQPH